MGVAEHIFDVPLHGRNVTWHLYDVGGARGQRHTWVPYFDDATAIIFLAPVSAFDQVNFCNVILSDGGSDELTVPERRPKDESDRRLLAAV